MTNSLWGLNNKQCPVIVYLGGDVKWVVYILPAPDLLSKLVAEPHKKIWPHLVFILAFPLARLYRM